MNDATKAAAERWRAYQYFKHADVNHALHVAGRDARDLADAYIAGQAQREREQAERAMPIDEAWLMSLGFSAEMRACVPLMRLDSEWHEVQVIVGGGTWLRSMKTARSSVRLGNMTTTTRGMMLDLLSALQINTKGPDE